MSRDRRYQRTENWLANRTYCSLDPTKIVLLVPIIAENKRKLTKEIFYLINITILNCFEQCKIEMKISNLHDRRSTVILNHQIDYFCNQLQYGFLTSIVCTNYSLLNLIMLMLYPITWPLVFRGFH